jgi:ketosteroid isomerase-like protein
MSIFWRTAVVAAIVLMMASGIRMKAGDSNSTGTKEIEAFNKKFVELHLKMDTPGIMAMWTEDGVDLMQGEAPIVGRKKITAWIEDILAKMPGYKVMTEEMEFHDIQVCGDWATEWATEHTGGASARGEAEF